MSRIMRLGLTLDEASTSTAIHPVRVGCGQVGDNEYVTARERFRRV